jgi:hypothetical protein
MPIHLAIRSHNATPHWATIPPIQGMISLIRGVDPDSVRGCDMQSHGTTRTASCLEYAYHYWPQEDLTKILYELSPIDILLIQNDDVSWSTRR